MRVPWNFPEWLPGERLCYGIGAIWEDQQWLVNRFHKFSGAIDRRVTTTFSSSKAEDAMRAVDAPPTTSAA